MKPPSQIIPNGLSAPPPAAPSAVTLAPLVTTDTGNLSAGAVVAPTRTSARASNYAWVAAATIMAIGLRFYYVRELLVQFALFSFGFLLLSLAVLSLFFVGYASDHAATWTGTASRGRSRFSGVSLHRQDREEPCTFENELSQTDDFCSGTSLMADRMGPKTLARDRTCEPNA